LIVDILREAQFQENEESNLLEAGVKHDLGGSSFVGVGVGAGLGDESPSFTGTLALEKQL
jgi:hypothetical protein